MPAFIPKLRVINASGSGVWGSITGLLDDQTDLKAVLDGKAALSHTHVESHITDLDKYTQAQVDSLLAGKANSSHTHLKADITDADWLSNITGELIESLQNVTLSGAWANDQLLVYSTASSALVNSTLTKALISDFSDGDYATAAQGSLADSSVQPGDNVSVLVNDSGYLTSYTETDPIFSASPSSGIIAQQITNWDLAFGWGDHGAAGYLTSFTETDPVFGASPAGGITGTNITNWDAAYSWGDHSLAGYALTASIPDSILDLTDVQELGPTNKNVLIYSSVAAKYQFRQLLKDDLSDFSDSDYATSAQGTLADTAIQPGDTVSSLTNDVGYLSSESDPVFVGSAAYSISTPMIQNWNTAHSWGDHSAEGYLDANSVLNSLFDVNVGTPSAPHDGYAVLWDNATSKFVLGEVALGSIATLNSIGDVNVGTPGVGEDGYSLIWDNATAKYILSNITGGGGGGLSAVVDDPAPVLGGWLDTGIYGLKSHLLFESTNTYDIGAPGGNQPKDIHLFGTLSAGGPVEGIRFRFQNDQDTEIYRPASNFLAFKAGNSFAGEFSTSFFALSNSYPLNWISSHGSTPDLGIERAAANTLRITDGIGGLGDLTVGLVNGIDPDHSAVGYLTDAPIDGGAYVRKDGIWSAGNLLYVDKINAQIVNGQKTFTAPVVIEDLIRQTANPSMEDILGVRVETEHGNLGKYIEVSSSTASNSMDIGFGMNFGGMGPTGEAARIEATRHPYRLDFPTSVFHDWVSREFDTGLTAYNTASKHTFYGDIYLPNKSILTGAAFDHDPDAYGKRDTIWIDPANTGTALFVIDLTNCTLVRPEEFLIIVDNAATGACTIYRGVYTHLISNGEAVTITGTPYVTSEGISLSFANFQNLATGDKFGFRAYQKGRALIDKIDEATANAGVTIEGVAIKDGLVDGVDLSLVSESQLAVDLAYQTTATIDYTPDFPTEGVLVIECFFGAAQTAAGPVSAGLITIQ